MKNRLLEKIAAVACALCLAAAVMSGAGLAKDEEPAEAPAPPEATFVVVDLASGEASEPELDVFAADTPAPDLEVTDNRTEVPYTVNGQEVGICPIIGGEPYVDPEELCWALGLAVHSSRTSDSYVLNGDNLSIQATQGDIYLVCNDRYVYAKSGLQFREGKALLPLEAMTKSLGITAAWDRIHWTVSVQGDSCTPLESGDTFYQDTDLYWLSRVIYAEADGQPFETKLAVGGVVVNRVASEEFPDQNNIYDVIFAKNQFDVVINGMIYMEPDSSSVIAAKLALEGYDNVDGATYFADKQTEGFDCVAWIGDYCFMSAA